MIITVTLNPVLDRTIYVGAALQPGTLNPALSTYVEPGGKGINVSRAIRALGGKSVALGFSAGANGRFMNDALIAADIYHDFVNIPGETRVNIQLIDSNKVQTQIHELGVPLSEPNFERFLERMNAYLMPENIFVISGSTPPEFSAENYRRMLKKIKDAGCRLICNTPGTFTDEVLAAEPDFVKCKVPELYRYLHKPVEVDPEKVAHDAMTLIEGGAKAVAISLEADGVIYISKEAGEAIYVVANPKIEDQGAIGTGDALVAAIANAMDQKFGYVELCKFGHAARAAAAQLPGTTMPTLSEVFRVHETLLVYTAFKF